VKAPPDRETLRKLYDALGLKQDRAARYEEPALEQLLEHGRFDTANSVFELGPGTGRFAENLLTNHLPKTATYRGVDFSATMVALTKGRLKLLQTEPTFTSRTVC
jgi:ubiquinone/menaquinone biosynthesis C-methylase UbiE